VKRVDLETGAAVTILEPSMLPAGAFLGPLTDVTFEDGHLWAVRADRGVGRDTALPQSVGGRSDG
jgi:hypothetical protein